MPEFFKEDIILLPETIRETEGVNRKDIITNLPSKYR